MPKAYIIHQRWISYRRYIIRSDKERISLQKASFVFYDERGLLLGAGSGGRTRTVSLPLDFESSTSANSIISAHIQAIEIDHVRYYIINP